jgi:serine/threonine-protein kinase
MGSGHEDPPSPPLPSGSFIGSYQLGALLADGGMGDVYEATHRFLPRAAAIKVLRESMQSARGAHEGLLQEAQILERLAHPAIARVYDVGVLPDGRPWVAMELLKGEPLADLLHRRGRLGPLEVARLMLELVPPLTAAHALGLVHCDLKPDNIMIEPGSDEAPPRVRLIDWGIARFAGAPARQSDVAAGTPHYMAPEQVRGEKVDARTDIYALGVVAYELLAGQPPFDAESPMDVAVSHLDRPVPPLDDRCDALPMALIELVHQMLRKSRADRPSFEQAEKVLRELCETLGTDGNAPDRIFIDALVTRPSRIRWTPTDAQAPALPWDGPLHERATRQLQVRALANTLAEGRRRPA